jgi:putative SOS response-associated peptidase YedK
MVERYTLTSLDEVAETFGVAAGDGVVPRFNIAPMQVAAIRTAEAIAPARWGLLPPWRGHGGKRGPHVVHAPLEAIEPTPLLRNAFQRQRCLVLADGFFVWRRTGKKPQPVWVHPAADARRPGARSRLVGLAGVATTHRDDGQLSFALIVGPARGYGPAIAEQLAAAGDAADASVAPVVIAADAYATWLTGSRDAARGLLAAPVAGWRADPVSPWVNSIDHDDPRCVEPLGNPAQGELF